MRGISVLQTIQVHRILLLACLICMFGGSIAGILVPAGLGWDFANFYDAGRRVAAGQIESLYNANTPIGGESPQGSLGFYGTPISAYLYAPLSIFQPEAALILFKVEYSIALFLALWLLYSWCREFESDRKISGSSFAALFAFLCLIFQPFWTPYRVGGQTTSIVLLLLVLALSAHQRSRLFQSALLCVCAVLIKPALATMLLFLMILSGRRYLIHVLTIGSGVALVSVGVMGWEVHELFVRQMISGLREVYPWYWNSSLYVSFENFRALTGHESFWRSSSSLLTSGLKLVVILTFFRVIIRSQARHWTESARRHFHFLMATLFFLLITQTVWEHYLMILFLFLSYVVSRSGLFAGGPLFLIRSIFFFCLFQNIILIDFFRARIMVESIPGLLLIGLLKSAPLLLTLLFLWKYDRQMYRSYTTLPVKIPANM